jgi:hypothetical protein
MAVKCDPYILKEDLEFHVLGNNILIKIIAPVRNKVRWVV